MTSQVVNRNPAEAIIISPEGLEIANKYLEVQDITKTADALGITSNLVSEYLSRREIKAYIDNVFMDIGYNNRFKLRELMDTVIHKKLEELSESDMGSSKDITEIIALSHKMSMDILDRQIKLEEAKAKNNIRSQTNVQINNAGVSNYDKLMEALSKNNNMQ